MFKCKECGKEFGDWHALGGHMRTHWGRKKEKVAEVPEKGEQRQREVIGRALGKLSEISPQEAWQIVVSWIIDVYKREQQRDEIIQAYRFRAQENETRIDTIQSELKKLQQMVVDRNGPNGTEI